MTETDHIKVDVLVIGAGGCGLTAALSAHEAGLEVAILEKADRAGGNTALSSGSIPAAGTSLQLSHGVTDSAQAFAKDLFNHTGAHDADALVGTLTDVSAELIDFLAAQGVALEFVSGYRHVGHSTARLHAPPARRGADLVTDLLTAVERCDIPLALGQGATRLIAKQGRIIGAIAGEDRIEADAVILACNGFAAAPELLATHCPVAAKAAYAGSPYSTGDALTWGAELGAGTGNLGAFQAHAGLSHRTGALMTWTLIERGAVIVDATGQRFGNETLGYSGFGELMMAHEGPFHMIYDAEIRDNVAAGQPDFAEACAMGAARQAADAAALAQTIGAPQEGLAATLASARDAAQGAAADPFGRQDWGLGALDAPYCASEIAPAIFHTQGGLRIDTGARVLTEAGDAIPGLYAGGGAAMGISGRNGARGYMSGNGLLSALGLGLIAGRSAARDISTMRTAGGEQPHQSAFDQAQLN
ncbi:FAD-dependent oxidoreductase [Oceanibium sediminis]|uniref:FAD-dependent oxidoreductase n=1 Tax=Oceanibium sediminis TaxID=2026339 RepID=UPI000DD4AA28|nr:FAD-dependent oxidoreductase [Oceanibium sediminis]